MRAVAAPVRLSPQLEQGTPPLLRVDAALEPKTTVAVSSLSLQLPDGVDAVVHEASTATVVDGEESYVGDFHVVYRLSGKLPEPLEVTIGYQACQGNRCFLPQRETFTLTSELGTAMALPSLPKDEKSSQVAEYQQVREKLDWFRLSARLEGYHGAEDFLAWLQSAEQGSLQKEETNPLKRTLTRFGFWLTLLLTMGLGSLLNLTPCVLPMIPVTLAIIGAGEKGGRGGLRGTVYGLGMAVAYGTLGVVAVLTGSRFGAVNASWWFNALVALLFVGLALAMFDVFLMDFSRYRAQAEAPLRSAGRNVAAFGFGALSAVLAGACTAPVLIWVLLMSADFYAKGAWIGLALPFALGVGMALPWPFLGAGLGRLPKPGTWMVQLKRVLGCCILIGACYYGWMAFRLWKAGRGDANWLADDAPRFEALLQEARQRRQPVLVDVGGPTCKNCIAMEMTTFRKPPVSEALARFQLIRLHGDLPKATWVPEFLNDYHILGLPTYLVLLPNDDEANNAEGD